jgi:hypothetical protein
MSEAGKAALAELARLIEQAEGAGSDWSVDERMESLEWNGGNRLQDEKRLMGDLRRRISFVIGVPSP